MTERERRNRKFLSDLFAGPFRRHAIIMDRELPPPDWSTGDFAISNRPVKDWVSFIMQVYESRLKWHESLDDDSVPCMLVACELE